MVDDSESRALELRDELMTFAYRILGSLLEAERVANHALASGEDDRSTLFRQVTQDCLSALGSSVERSLPAHTITATESSAWLEPFPDDLYRASPGSGEPAYAERETMSIYFALALQSLVPRWRAPLVLVDAMGWTLAEALGPLDVDISEAEDLLAAARGAFSRSYMAGMGRREPLGDADGFTLSMRYIHQWEAGNADGLLGLLSDRAILQEIPSGDWSEGPEAIERSVRARAFGDSPPGRWRLLPKRANGQMAFAVFQRNEARRSYQAHSIQVLHFDEEGICEIISFAQPRLFDLFGLLSELPMQGR